MRKDGKVPTRVPRRSQTERCPADGLHWRDFESCLHELLFQLLGNTTAYHALVFPSGGLKWNWTQYESITKKCTQQNSNADNVVSLVPNSSRSIGASNSTLYGRSTERTVQYVVLQESTQSCSYYFFSFKILFNILFYSYQAGSSFSHHQCSLISMGTESWG